jgi:hypothetical protein
MGFTLKLSKILSKCDLAKLYLEAKELSYTLDGSNALMAITQSGGVPNIVKNKSELMKALEEIGNHRKTPVLNVMINIMEPGLVLPKHRDWIKPSTHQPLHPIIERWHLPIRTNPECRWWGEKTGFVRMEHLYWCGPMPYWEYHTFENNGLTERIHLVVDLDTKERIGQYEEESSGNLVYDKN